MINWRQLASLARGAQARLAAGLQLQ